MPAEKQWFETWFNTRYYDVLYQHRDQDEAALFIDALLQYLHPAPSASILDAACGKGRHTTYLGSKGFDVTGIDLSYKNISEAKFQETQTISFFQHDMRKVFRLNYFDYIFNFYTSFGYFTEDKDDISCLKAFASGLKTGGKLVLDFFNTDYIMQHLTGEITNLINGNRFTISKTCDKGFIIKKIQVEDHGEKAVFYEKVKAITLEKFETFMSAAGLKPIAYFGGYQLQPFDPATSERLIIIAEK